MCIEKPGWVEDALFRPEVRAAFKNLLLAMDGCFIRKLYPTETIYTFGIISVTHTTAMRGCVLIIFLLATRQ
jgi:hypothetical protein